METIYRSYDTLIETEVAERELKHFVPSNSPPSSKPRVERLGTNSVKPWLGVSIAGIVIAILGWTPVAILLGTGAIIASSLLSVWEKSEQSLPWADFILASISTAICDSVIAFVLASALVDTFAISSDVSLFIAGLVLATVSHLVVVVEGLLVKP